MEKTISFELFYLKIASKYGITYKIQFNFLNQLLFQLKWSSFVRVVWGKDT